MLTSDLVRARRKDGAIHPLYLRGDAPARLFPYARAITETFAAMLGRTREELEEALDEIPCAARDRVVALGLRKLCEDRCEFDVTEGADPTNMRREVFFEAAAAHRALDVRGAFDREAVLVAVAARLATTVADIDSELYADLRGSEVLTTFRPIGAGALLERYNIALAQSLLLKATRVAVRIEGEPATRYRDVFRAIRFHGLLHVVVGDPELGYTIVLDGPFSLFGPSLRYGLKLALFLPALLACRTFHLRADVLWGKAREPAIFELGPKDGLVVSPDDAPALRPELEAFCEGFRKLASPWKVAANERIFAAPGEPVVLPDLELTHGETGERVYLEVFGFWSRAAVWTRIEQLRSGFPARLILAVCKQLRVSEEALGEGDAGELYVYRATLSPRAVLARLGCAPP